MGRSYRPTLIYAMLDPRNGNIRYIGQTRMTLDGRRGWHLKDDRPCPRVVWIQELLRTGMAPIMIHLEEVRGKEAGEREKWWISFARGQKWPILNQSDGGEGCDRYNNRAGRTQGRPRK